MCGQAGKKSLDRIVIPIKIAFFKIIAWSYIKADLRSDNHAANRPDGGKSARRNR